MMDIFPHTQVPLSFQWFFTSGTTRFWPRDICQDAVIPPRGHRSSKKQLLGSEQCHRSCMTKIYARVQIRCCLVVYLRLWRIYWSVEMMTFPIFGKTIQTGSKPPTSTTQICNWIIHLPVGHILTCFFCSHLISECDDLMRDWILLSMLMVFPND